MRLETSDLQSTISTANLLSNSGNLHHRRRYASYSSSDDDDMLPNTVGACNTTATVANGNVPAGGSGCGSGNGNCCSTTSTASPTTTTIVVDIEDLLNKRNLEQNKKDSKDTDITSDTEQMDKT